uniref:Retrovirus-related Pol polyprotein from transposon 17.6 n=1 Tax=Cajanus cajan TaxID=3821 RepID=A0A151T0L4_CAJCA|nr:Retrovirus-related Pol polyprotein from transposon 17.6 [Cajanus cajan]
MNDIFRKHLQKIILVFFDDILVYTKIWEDHLKCLQINLQIIQDNSITLNLKKCSFGKSQVDYLGHQISATSMHPDLEKLQLYSDGHNLKI